MAEYDPDRDTHGVEDPRLTALDAKLRDAKAREAARTGTGPTTGDGGYSLGNRVLSAMIGSLVGGALIGWVIDRLAGTGPAARPDHGHSAVGHRGRTVTAYGRSRGVYRNSPYRTSGGPYAVKNIFSAAVGPNSVLSS